MAWPDRMVWEAGIDVDGLRRGLFSRVRASLPANLAAIIDLDGYSQIQPLWSHDLAFEQATSGHLVGDQRLWLERPQRR